MNAPESLRDDAIDELQRSWTQQQCLPVEELLNRYPSLKHDNQAVLDLIYAEVLLREENEGFVDEADCIARFPELREEIARQFQLHRALQDPSPGLDASTFSDVVTVSDLTASPAFSVPSQLTIPGFEIQEVAGRGGCGVVYRARDQELNRTVAIKVLQGIDAHDSPRRQQLLHEAEAVAQLNHPSIVPVYQIGEAFGTPYVVMEYIPGASLAGALHKGPMPVKKAVDVVAEVVRAITYAHENAIIHRDIKPGNVLLDEAGAAHVCDFGLATRLDSEHTLHATGDVFGTPAYMSPEQCRGEKADVRSDIYSIGAVLYECLTGRPPFQAASTWEVLHQVMTNDVTPLRQLNSSLPKDLETICLKCLEKLPQRRYATASELQQELIRFQEGRPIQARPVSRVQRLWKTCLRNKALATTIVLLFVSLVTGTTVSTVNWLESERNAAAATQLAADLKMNQTRMRDSVSRFQSRVFADESLYLQMSGNLRTELFRDVIAYLDEFAVTDLGSPDALSRSDSDDLTAQYLKVAEAAHSVADYAECEIAANRALDRIRDITNQAGKDNPAMWHQRCVAAKLLFLSRAQPREGETEVLATDQMVLGQESTEAAEQAISLETTNGAYILARQVSRWELLRFQSDGNVSDSALHAEEIVQIYEDIEASLIGRRSDPLGIEQRKYLVRIGQYLLPGLKDERREAVRAKLKATVLDLREGYRASKQPLSETHCMLARNLALDAQHLWESKQRDLALKTLIDAETFFERAINPIPNNRPWRRELIQVELLISDWLAEQNKAEPARDKADEAIRNTIHLLESDPKDNESRKLVVRCLIRFGDLSAVLQDSPAAYRGYFTAAHDCHFLFTAGGEWRSWALPVRAWAAAQAYAHADENTREAIIPSELKMYDTWEALFDFDSKWLSDAFLGKIEVPRPDGV